MTSPERMKRVSHFYSVIENYAVVPISYRLNKQDFLVGQQRAREMLRKLYNANVDFAVWTNPYFFCVRGLMESFHVQRSKITKLIPLDQRVDFIFDDNVEKKPILDAWDEIVDRHNEGAFGATPRIRER